MEVPAGARDSLGVVGHSTALHITKMKHIKKLFLAGLALALFSPAANALPWSKGGTPIERIHKKKQIDKLGPGSQLVLVCKGSDSVMLIDIKDKKEAIKWCTEGRMIHCRDCRRKYKVIWKNATGKGPGPMSIMEIVNAKGEPCMFFARIK